MLGQRLNPGDYHAAAPIMPEPQPRDTRESRKQRRGGCQDDAGARSLAEALLGCAGAAAAPGGRLRLAAFTEIVE
jgi:hypothetical protein